MGLFTKQENMLDIGDKVPDLSLPSSTGGSHSLQDFKGKKIILYFYPKDDTPGCTKESCEFRDAHQDFSDLNAVIIGVSKDPLASHEKFINKYELPFELWADEDLKLMEAFGAWGKKKMYGKSFLGVIRSTFLIDENGVVQKAWRKVRVKDHVTKVLEAAKNL